MSMDPASDQEAQLPSTGTIQEIIRPKEKSGAQERHLGLGKEHEVEAGGLVKQKLMQREDCSLSYIESLGFRNESLGG